MGGGAPHQPSLGAKGSLVLKFLQDGERGGQGGSWQQAGDPSSRGQPSRGGIFLQLMPIWAQGSAVVDPAPGESESGTVGGSSGILASLTSRTAGGSSGIILPGTPHICDGCFPQLLSCCFLPSSPLFQWFSPPSHPPKVWQGCSLQGRGRAWAIFSTLLVGSQDHVEMKRGGGGEGLKPPNEG